MKVYFRVLLFFLISLSLSIVSGCPSGGEGTADGGIPEKKEVSDQIDNTNPGSCPSGASCLSLTGEKARSCSLLLELSSDKIGKVEFHAALRGRFVQRDNRLAVGFIWRRDEPLVSGAIAVKIYKDSGQKKLSWKILKQNCYDRLGKPLQSVKFSSIYK